MAKAKKMDRRLLPATARSETVGSEVKCIRASVHNMAERDGENAGGGEEKEERV